MRVTELQPLILGLVESLPPPGTIWPREKRAQWITVAACCLDLIYHDDPSEQPARAAPGAGRGRIA
jgi:hypothetical protein